MDNFTVGRKYKYNGPRLSVWKKGRKTGYVCEVSTLTCVGAKAGGYARFAGQDATNQAGRDGCWDYSKVLRHFVEVGADGQPIKVNTGVVDFGTIDSRVNDKYFKLV